MRLRIIHNFTRKNERDDHHGNQSHARLVYGKTDCQERDDGTLDSVLDAGRARDELG